MKRVLAALKEKKSRVVLSEIIALFFALTFVCGYELQNDGFTMRGISGKLIILLISLALSLLIFPVSFFVLYSADKMSGCDAEKTKAGKLWKMFFVTVALIFVAWIPMFLAYYPCIMSSDFDIQLYQVKQGHQYFTNHHPFLSTLEIEFFYRLGPHIGSVRKGMAALGLFHMAALSATFSYMTVTAYRLVKKKWLTVVLVLVTIIYPINPLMTLSTTKDTLFSAFFLMLLCLLINRLFFENSKKINVLYDCLIVIDGIFMCSYRNNAMYAVLAGGLVVVLFASKKKKLYALILTVAIVCFYKLFQFGLVSYLGADGETDHLEKHSIILQCFGRTYVNNEATLPDETREILEYYMSEEALETFEPSMTTYIKETVRNNTYEEHWKGQMGKVVKDWIKVGIEYPDDYLDAILDLTRGYWYLGDNSFAKHHGEKLEDHMGIIYTYNSSGYYGMEEIPQESKAPAIQLFYEKLLSRNDIMKIPVVRFFFRLSLYMMGFLLIMVLYAYKKEWKKLALTAVPFFYFCTMLLGPIAYVRYSYPYTICLPLYIVLLFAKDKSPEKGC